MESIKVYLRIRPFSSTEKLVEQAQAANAVLSPSGLGPAGVSRSSFGLNPAVPVPSGPLFQIIPPNAVTMNGVPGTLGMMAAKSETFTFDFVTGPETEQRNMFESVGRRIVDRCLEGYNGTIFAYGQTGSGKTYTMQGAGSLTDMTNDARGLIPRCMEYLFQRIAEKAAADEQPVEYLCKASYLEIYNENIHDLLDPACSMRSIREDINRGIFVDGITEETITNPTDAYRLFERGATNRHVSSTAMNRESSRSHSVLTLIIQSKSTTGDLVDVRESRFNLVDLAGSERQKTAGTSGQRLKEAANINKSLSALGSVINALVEAANGKLRHVHYRDSKLTFLLRDSLGGNSITWIIANTSPATINAAESLGTLKFAQRAKMIKNKAIVNQDTQGSVAQLQAELKKLRMEIALLKAEGPQPPTAAAPISNLSAYPKTPGRDTAHLAQDPGYNTPTMPMPMAIASPLSVNHGDMLQFMNLLNLSSRKLRQVEREKTIYSEEIVQLGESNRRKEYKIQALQMINKFQKAHIDQLRSDKGLDVLVDGERAMLKLEVMELEKCMQNNPQVTRFALENLQLRQQLERYQDIENRYLEGEWWDPYEEDSLVLSERIAMLVSDWASANATTFESPESLKQRAYQPTPAPSECISPSDIGNWLNDQSDSEFLRYRMEELQTDLDINVKTLHSQSERLTAYTTSHQQLDQVYSKLCTTLDRPMQVLCLDPKDYDPEDRLPELESAVMHSRKAAYELILEHPALSSASYGPVHSTNGCNGNGNMGGMSASESARMSSTADMGCIRLASTLMSYLRSSLSICEWMIDHYHHGSGGSRTDGEKRSNAVTIQHLENTIQTLTTQLEQTRYELKLSGEGASDHRAALWDALQLLPNIPNDDFRSMEPAVVRRRIEALVDQFQAGRQRIQALETEIAFHRQQANRPTTNGQHLSAELPPLPSPSTTRRNGLRNMDSAKSLDDLIRPRNPSYSRSSVHRVDTI